MIFWMLFVIRTFRTLKMARYRQICQKTSQIWQKKSKRIYSHSYFWNLYNQSDHFLRFFFAARYLFTTQIALVCNCLFQGTLVVESKIVCQSTWIHSIGSDVGFSVQFTVYNVQCTVQYTVYSLTPTVCIWVEHLQVRSLLCTPSCPAPLPPCMPTTRGRNTNNTVNISATSCCQH